MAFSAYDYSQPPECCFCPSAVDPSRGDVVVNVETAISGGYGQLAVMTRSEDAFIVIERARNDEELGPVVAAGFAPMWTDEQQRPWLEGYMED